MHVSSPVAAVKAAAGEALSIPIDVINPADVIEGFKPVVHGLGAAGLSVEPAVLRLFPRAEGRLTLTILVPRDQIAGRRLVTVEVVSETGRVPTRSLDLDLVVPARPAATLRHRPARARARRSARFLLEIANVGNVPLDLSLDAAARDPRVRARFAPASLRLGPGATRPVVATITAARMLTGAEVDRPVRLVLEGVESPAIAAVPPGSEPAGGTDGDDVVRRAADVRQQIEVVLRQRPIVSRGAVTALILTTIVGLWAAIFAFGLGRAFGQDAVAMTPALTFFATDPLPAAAGDAVPSKSGPLPPGVGGTIEGIVRARSTQAPQGRILVEAFRVQTGTGRAVLVGSTATLSDGSYALAGLLPGRYQLRISAPGFLPAWFPDQAMRSAGQIVVVQPRVPTRVAAATITGLPATVLGEIDTAGDRVPAPTVITATATNAVADSSGNPQAKRQGRPSVQVTATTGAYRLTGLMAPATYTLTFQTPGYRDRTATVTVDGGDRRQQPSIVPGAEDGVIVGRVTDGRGRPVGGATVQVEVDGRTRVLTTPTTGDIGSFSFGDLPVPGSYAVSVTAPGYGATTRIVLLDARDDQRRVRIVLGARTGTVSGRLVGLDGRGLGGAVVTVGGSMTQGNAAPSTTTLTSEDVGAFTISGLDAPHAYTLTFSLSGYSTVTIPVVLPSSGPVEGLVVRLGEQLGRIAGKVVGEDGRPLGGAVVTVTDGRQRWSATTAVTGGTAGDFLLDGLGPGTYAATATAPGRRQTTLIIRVIPGVTSQSRFTLEADG